MRFVMPTQELNFILSKMQNITPLKPSVPLLGNILLEVKEGRLTVTATDLQLGVRCQTEVKELEEGSTTVPGKRFSQLIRELTTPSVEIYTNPSDITEVISGSSKFKILGLSRKEFPKLPDMQGAALFKIKEKTLKELFYKVSFAAAKEDVKQVLNGIYASFSNSTLTLTATDGKRLSRASTSIDMDPSFRKNILIPVKAADEFLRSFGEEGDATLHLLQDRLAIETDSISLITKLLQGEYPEVDRIIPEKTETVISLHKDELSTLLRQISLFTNEDHVSVKFSFNQGNLFLSANTTHVGEGKVSMPANYHGEPLQIALSPTFLLDFLRHCKEEVILFGMTDPYNPSVITEKEGDSKESSLYVIMPMRISEG